MGLENMNLNVEDVESALVVVKANMPIIKKIKDFFSKRKDPYTIEETLSICCDNCISVLEQIRRKEVTHQTAENLVKFKGYGVNAQSIQLCYLIPIVYLRINERYAAIQHVKHFEKLVENNLSLSQLAEKLRADIENLP